MSSLIEQAQKRLEQLRAAGVDVPEVDGKTPEATALQPDSLTTPELAVMVAAASETMTREAVPAALPQASMSSTPQPAATAQAAAPPSAAAAATPAAAPPREATSVSRRVELDLAGLTASGMIVTPQAPRTELADQFRVIKRPLISNATGRGAAMLKHGNLIMVSSALQGEGKSFTAVNLAMSIAAELDHTVMLVDADVARPSIVRILGLPEGPGLMDVLQGKASLPEALMRTNVEKLTILPSGSPHPKATELLASDAMGRLLDDMATRYADRIIIFDSPPLLLTTESRVLATHMGQIVLVVAAGRTVQSNVEAALQTIEACPVKLMLLNKARTAARNYGYGYGYSGYGAQAPRVQLEG